MARDIDIIVKIKQSSYGKLNLRSFKVITKTHFSFVIMSIKLFPTQRELKGLGAQVISTRHNLSTSMYARH